MTLKLDVSIPKDPEEHPGYTVRELFEDIISDSITEIREGHEEFHVSVSDITHFDIYDGGMGISTSDDGYTAPETTFHSFSADTQVECTVALPTREGESFKKQISEHVAGTTPVGVNIRDVTRLEQWEANEEPGLAISFEEDEGYTVPGATIYSAREISESPDTTK